MIGILLFLFLFIIFTIISLSLNIYFMNFNVYLLSLIRVINSLFFLFVIYFKINSKYWKYSLSFIIAGNTGNMLSKLIPPFKVADFLLIHKMNAVFNFADVFIIIFCILLMISPFYFISKYFIKKIKNRGNSEL
jgi:lipoprotein signal peptidase